MDNSSSRIDEVSIYMGTSRIGYLADWRGAESYVKTLAHADGVTGGAGWERTRSGYSFSCGIFRAVNTYRARMNRGEPK